VISGCRTVSQWGVIRWALRRLPFNYLDLFMDFDELSNYEDTRIFHISD
jgi:hypothetical protein